MDKKIKDLISIIDNSREKILEKIEIYHRKGNNIFINDLSQFSPNFEIYLSDYLVDLLIDTGLAFENNVLRKATSKYKEELFHLLDKSINEKILCEITFENGYSLFKAFEALEKVNTKAIFKINADNLEVFTTNDSKTYLMRMILKVKVQNFSFFKNSELLINLTNLVKILKCTKSECIVTTLKFKEEQLDVELCSKTYKSKISRILVEVKKEFEKDESLEELIRLNYSGYFIIDKNKFLHILSQSGRFSEVIKLNLTNNFISISENYIEGNSEIRWEKNLLSELKIMSNNLEKNTINTYFSIENLKNFTPFLFEDNPLIKFYLQEEIPIKICIKFKSLEDSYGLFFLAQREADAYE